MNGDPTLPILKRILVVKLADLGDAVLATSAIGALRDAYPGARIDVLAAGASEAAFRLCPAIDHVITIDKHAFDHPAGLADPRHAVKLLRVAATMRAAHYDAVALLHHLTTPFGALKFRWLCGVVGAPIRAGLDNGRGTFLTHRVADLGFGSRSIHEYGLDVAAQLGAPVKDTHPGLAVPENAREAAGRLLRDHGVSGDYVVIHPGVGGYSQARNWFPDRFASIAASIRDRFNLSIVLVGASDATQAARAIADNTPVVDLTRATSVAELAALLECAKLVLGADSGVVHLAAALGRPVIAVFGPSNHHAWSPFGSEVINIESQNSPTAARVVVRADLPCSPCFYTGYSLGRRQGCAHRTCLELVTANRVTQIAIDILTRTDAPQTTNS